MGGVKTEGLVPVGEVPHCKLPRLCQVYFADLPVFFN